jgi:hypothetical protein
MKELLKKIVIFTFLKKYLNDSITIFILFISNFHASHGSDFLRSRGKKTS